MSLEVVPELVEAAVRAGRIGSMMHAYHDLDGVPCVASTELLTTTLREAWGFDGVVVSDYMGIEQLVTLHELTTDRSTAAGLALAAGVDVELPTTDLYGSPLEEALGRGTVDGSLVDRAVARWRTGERKAARREAAPLASRRIPTSS